MPLDVLAVDGFDVICCRMVKVAGHESPAPCISLLPTKEPSMRSLPFVGLITLCAGCASGGATAGGTPSGSAAGASAPLGRSYMANMVPTGTATARLAGTVTLSPTDANSYRVEMDLTAGATDRQYPWVIRPGSCGDATPNSDLGGRAAYGPIQTHNDGSAHVNTSLRIQLPPGQTVHIDIMLSASQRDVIVSCGVLMAR